MALLQRLSRRLRQDAGFGLIELLAAMLMLNIGILALVSAFSSSQVALRRAGRIATAASIADRQMELYRALRYTSILLDLNSINAADETYKCDLSYGIDTAPCDPHTDTDPAANAATTTACTTPLGPECTPVRTVTGADGKIYRVDTYITTQPVTAGRDVRRVTIVVRNGADLTAAPFARQSSNFDQSTG